MTAEASDRQRQKLWFQKREAVDQAIRDRFPPQWYYTSHEG